MKPSISQKPTPGQPNAATPAKADDLIREKRDELRTWMKSQRLAMEPRPTQIALSKMLDYPYSIVTAWENGTRLILASQFSAWCKAVGVDETTKAEMLERYKGAILPSEKASKNAGSRMDADVNARLKELRKKLGFSLREMADAAGITAGHLQRIEANTGNISVAQVRNVHQRLRVSYDWLIDGVGEFDEKALHERLARANREIQLLEELRLANKNG